MTDRRERQKQARAAAKEAQRKAAARKELRRRITVGLGLGAAVAIFLLVIGTFSSSDENDLPEALEAFRNQPTACDGSVPDPPTEMQFDEPINQALRADSEVTATLETSCGTIVMELDNAQFPQTVSNFVFLARNGYYDGTAFHRVAPDFVIQGGDPMATGSGDPGYSIPDEVPSEGFVYEPGVVAMANSGRNTTGSQFFIVSGESAATLNPSFNVLGRVVEGMDVVERIAEIPTRTQPGARERSYPTESIYLESVTITVDN
ncbi:MAG: peptidylprolyl isomerase [Acidimicrobiia bacterium]